MTVSCGGLILVASAIMIIAFVYDFPYPLSCSIPLEQPCGMVYNTSLFTFGEGCGAPIFEIICENNRSVIYFNYGKRHAKAIIAFPNSSSFRYITTGVSPDNNFPIIHSFSLPYENVSFLTYHHVKEFITVMRCEKPVDGDWYSDISSGSCVGGSDNEEKQYSYLYAVDDSFKSYVTGIEESCRIEMKVVMSMWDGKVKCNSKYEYKEVETAFVNGIEVRWRPISCEEDSDELRLPLSCTLLNAAAQCFRIGALRKSIILHCYFIRTQKS